MQKYHATISSGSCRLYCMPIILCSHHYQITVLRGQITAIMCVKESVVYLGLPINTCTHSMHTQIFHPLSSINTFSVRVTQQINHHGYSNIIIALLKVHSDWWCLWDHLNVSNDKNNNLHPFNNIISDWRLSDLLGKMGIVSSINITQLALFLILKTGCSLHQSVCKCRLKIILWCCLCLCKSSCSLTIIIGNWG